MILGDIARAGRTAQAGQGPQQLLCTSLKEPSSAGSPHHNTTTGASPALSSTQEDLATSRPDQDSAFSSMHSKTHPITHNSLDRHSCAWKSSNDSMRATCTLLHPECTTSGRSPIEAQTPTPTKTILLSYLCPVLSSAILA